MTLLLVFGAGAACGFIFALVLVLKRMTIDVSHYPESQPNPVRPPRKPFAPASGSWMA